MKMQKIAKKLQNANEKINDYVDRLENINKNLEEGNEDLKALLDASSTVIENMDSKKIAQGIVDIIPKSLGHLGSKGGVFLIYDRDKRSAQDCEDACRDLIFLESISGKVFYVHE